MRAAITRSGLRAARVTPLSTLGGPARSGAAFCVELETGRRVKARRLENEAAAKRQQALRADLPTGFTPVLDRVGHVLIEPWVDGRRLDGTGARRADIRRAGELLASLHAVQSADGQGLPFFAEVTELLRDVDGALRHLLSSAALEPSVVDRLAALTRDAPAGACLHCLIHTDFCAENLVVDADGHLTAIDNEHCRFGPPGMDLARSWYRWGWHVGNSPSADWDLFRTAYLDAGGYREARSHEPFWRMAATVISARVRLAAGADAGVALDALQRLAHGTIV